MCDFSRCVTSIDNFRPLSEANGDILQFPTPRTQIDITRDLTMKCIFSLKAKFFVILFLTLGRVSYAQECLPQYAPAAFPFKADPSSPKGHPVNVGIVTEGFVALKGVDVVHGIDVSKWQEDTDFSTLRRCLSVIEHGPEIGKMHPPFVYVRISAGENPDNETLYRSHWYTARNINLYVGPYHALVLTDSSTPTSELDEEDLRKLKDINLLRAEHQANLFTERLGQLLLADPLDDVAPGDHGKPYLPIVLALIDRPETPNSAADRISFGKIYGAAACHWIDRVRESRSFQGQKVIIFTSASVFSDYDLYSAPCDLRADGVWISQHTFDGTRRGVVDKSAEDLDVKKLCASPNGDRCIFQQYTSYGGFSLFKKDAPLDLDRFYGTEVNLVALLQHARHPEIWK